MSKEINKEGKTMEMCPSCGEVALGEAAHQYGDGLTCLTCYYEND